MLVLFCGLLMGQRISQQCKRLFQCSLLLRCRQAEKLTFHETLIELGYFISSNHFRYLFPVLVYNTCNANIPNSM